jgi:GNAT superfamily N-acetyltransferase
VSAPGAVRPLAERDRVRWGQLWEEYYAFYRHTATAAVARATFDRLVAAADMFGLVAVDGDDRPVGLAHAVLHPSTWTDGRYCYLEDLFVARSARGGGVGRALIEAVYAAADARGAVRVYWHTQEFNAPARSLYDEVGRRTSFIVYTR